jgi:heptosyltransferase-2
MLAAATNILVRSTNWVGDAVMSLPALRQLRLAAPSACITLLARPWVSAVFEREPSLDRLLLYEGRGWRGWLEAARMLRPQRFDAALLFQNAFEAALIARCAGIPVRCGYARDGRRWLLTHAVAVPAEGEIPRHESYYYLELLRRLGVIRELPQVEHILLASPPAREVGRRRLADFGLSIGPGQPVVGISPGAAFGTAKRWLPERFAAVGRALAGRGAALVVFGSGLEKALADWLAAQIGPPALSTAGRTSLAGFLELVAGCDLFISNDSGAMHLAAAAGVAVLAIFGATDEIATAPLGPRVRIIKKPVDCSPCKLRECPTDHRCMLAIEPEDVLAAAEQMLDAGDARRFKSV